MLFRGKSLVGLDIGSSSVKATLLKPTKSGYELAAFGMEPLPPDTIVDGAVMSASAVVDTLRKLFQTHRIRNKQVALGISGHSVIIKKINLPQMTPQELEDSIQWEAEQYIPFDIAEVHLDTQILNAESAIRGQMDVLLVAAKREHVSEYVTAVQEAGLTPVIVDVAAFAVQNQYEINYELPRDRTIVLVNVGAAVTSINVLAEGNTAFTRDLSMGGRQFTEEIQKQLNVSFEEAESLKLGGSFGGDEDAIVPQEVERVLAQVSQTVAQEVQRSLDFYSATTADTAISQVYLTGGGAKLTALQRAIEARLGVSVELLNPFRNVQVDPKRFDKEHMLEVGPQAAVSVGLALRRPFDK